MFTNLTRFAPLGTVAAAAFIAAAPQEASALEFKYTGAKVPPFVNVDYVRTKPDPEKSVDGQPAGAFAFTDMTSGGTLGDFIAWCFDLDTTISEGTYTYEEASNLLDSNPPYVSDAQDRVQKLFDFGYETALTSKENSAGFQLALWEVLYDTGYDLTAGNFTGGSSNTDAATAANAFLSGASMYGDDRKWVITTYDSDEAQDIGVATAIPLPAAAWLLLGVSGALVAAKRRSARRA